MTRSGLELNLRSPVRLRSVMVVMLCSSCCLIVSLAVSGAGETSVRIRAGLLLGDADRVDFVTLADGIHHVLARCDLTEHSVHAVKVRLGGEGNEELAPVGPGAGIGHRQHA